MLNCYHTHTPLLVYFMFMITVIVMMMLYSPKYCLVHFISRLSQLKPFYIFLDNFQFSIETLLHCLELLLKERLYFVTSFVCGDDNVKPICLFLEF